MKEKMIHSNFPIHFHTFVQIDPYGKREIHFKRDKYLPIKCVCLCKSSVTSAKIIQKTLPTNDL